jgi:hypothetical protein
METCPLDTNQISDKKDENEIRLRLEILERKRSIFIERLARFSKPVNTATIIVVLALLLLGVADKSILTSKSFRVIVCALIALPLVGSLLVSARSRAIDKEISQLNEHLNRT